MNSITVGESAYRMYSTILDKSGVDEADKWRKSLPLPYKRMLKSFIENYVDEEGNVKDIWQSEQSVRK